MFEEQLDWINKLLEDYMKDNKVATESKTRLAGSKSKADEANKKKSWNSRLSFKSKA